MKYYCLRCRESRRLPDDSPIERFDSSNGKNMWRGICDKCNKEVIAFSKKKIDEQQSSDHDSPSAPPVEGEISSGGGGDGAGAGSSSTATASTVAVSGSPN